MKLPNVEMNQMVLRVLTDEQIEEILQASFSVLEQVGCRILHKEAVKMLKSAGARVKGEVVKVPRQMVQECLDHAPKGFTIYDRGGEPRLYASGRNVYFGTSTASPNTIDARTGEVHPTTINDIARGAKVADALPHIDWIMPFGSAQDVPGDIAEVFEFDAAVRNTTKPVVFCGYSGRGVEMVYEMAAEVAGGLENLQERPFVVCYPEPITPLTFPEEVVNRMLVTADLMQPQIPTGSQQPGATAPITLAGSLAQATAESLMSVVLVQLRRKGTPVFLACNFGGFNMKTGIMSIVPPEASLGLAAQAQIARSLGLPTWGLAGATDAKLLDAQAGAESAFTILSQALAGINLIHDVGYMEMGMSCSCDMLVLGDELIGWAKRFLRGIRINDEEIGLEAIRSVGPGGNYLLQRQTLERCRSEYWMPELFSREPRATWETKGASDMKERVHRKVLRLLDGHQVPELPPETIRALEDIKERVKKDRAGKGKR